MTDSDSPTQPAAGGASATEHPGGGASDLDDLRAALALQREADAMIAEALEAKRASVDRAEAIVREAEQAAARAEETAARAAAERLAVAQQEADRLLADAREEADRITGKAHGEVDALRRDASDLRDTARHTLEAAEQELARVRDTEAERERELAATRSEAVRLVESLEAVAAVLEGQLETLRRGIAAARRNLELLPGPGAAGHGEEEAADRSVVLAWPHQAPTARDPQQAGQGQTDTALTSTAQSDTTEADAYQAWRSSKHRRADAVGRRGLLRRARP